MSRRLQTVSQDTRIAQLYTPLGKDELVLVRLEGAEALSELFEYRIEAVSQKPDLNFDQAVGQQCGVKAQMYGKEREFNGVLVEAQSAGISNDFFLYRLVLRPWLWLLSRKADCRIFQRKTAPEIIKDVFTDAGFADFESLLTDEGSYPSREYCVQYRETDLNFISRIMEKEGIYYFFKHEGGKHILMLADSASSHQPCKDLTSVPFLPEGGQHVRREQRVHEWISERRFCTGKVELSDYNYEKPNASLTAGASAFEKYTKSDLQVYDYPGNYLEKSVGERYAKIRLQAEQALDYRRHANGDAISLYPGGLTTLERHPSGAQNIEYLVVRCSHSLAAEQYRSGSPGPAEEIYHGRYEFQPKDRPFRSPIVTPKPLIHGVQTAKVVTKDSAGCEEIDVEKLSEIYVRFYWDHHEMRSCKLRCAQAWSGKGWGGQFIPRVGMEVVIEFLEGDPDRPLVVGTVYNDECKPPYDLPGNKTMTGMKSRSTIGGGGFNEFIFEDKKGSENIRTHAQKDYNVTILNTETVTIGEKYTDGKISRSTTLIKGSDDLVIEEGNQSLDIMKGSQTVHIKQKQTIDVEDEISITAKNKITLTVGKSTITMEPQKIAIASPTINTESQLKTTVQGGAALDLLAALIKIN